jgi:hypothetical protein
MTKTLFWTATRPRGRQARLFAAVVLRAAGRAHDRMAVRLVTPPAPVPQTMPTLEFHADAGAPEGALYVDGELFARLPVNRL